MTNREKQLMDRERELLLKKSLINQELQHIDSQKTKSFRITFVHFISFWTITWFIVMIAIKIAKNAG